MPKIAMNGDAARLSQEKKKKKKAQNLVLINSQVTLINGISQNGISIKYLSPLFQRPAKLIKQFQSISESFSQFSTVKLNKFQKVFTMYEKRKYLKRIVSQ